MFEGYNINEEEKHHIKRGVYATLVLIIILTIIAGVAFLFGKLENNNGIVDTDIQKTGIQKPLTDEEKRAIEKKFKSTVNEGSVSDTQKASLEKNFGSSAPATLSEDEKRAIEERFNNSLDN